MRTKIYLAGRITGNPNYKAEFGVAERYYKDRGYIVMNPARLPDDMEYSDYARICAAMIDSADAVLLMPDWEMSPGARLEKAYADYIRKPVIQFDESVEKDGKIETKEKRPPVWKVAVVSGALQKKRVRRSVADEILDRFMSEEF